MQEKPRKNGDEDHAATIDRILDAFPSYEDYISGRIKAFGFLYDSKTKRSSYMWTTIEDDAEVDQAYFEEFCSEGLFDTIAIFTLHKIIKWGKKEDTGDESEKDL